MKKKFSLWFNIATLCLCVCAIAIGVYAAQSATLTVTGSIGFTAHKLQYSATATIKGYMTDPDDDSTFVSAEKTLDVSNDGSIALPKGTNNGIYFSDLNGETVQDIVIKLSITNLSDFPIEVTSLALPTDATLQSRVTFSVQNGLAQMGDKNDSATKTQDIIITMSLNGEENLTLTNVNFSLELKKYQKIKYDATTGYYATMGSNVVKNSTTNLQEVKPVKWLPIAEMAKTETDTYGEATKFDYKTTEPKTGNRYYFISENILDFGNGTKPTPESGTIYGGAYGVAYANELNSSYYSTKTNYTDFYAQDYLISNVRELLTSEDGVQQYALYNSGATPYGSNISLLKEYGLQGYTYASITAREASELHEVGCDSKTFDNFQTSEKSADKLWLLSKTEVNTYFADNTARTAVTFRDTEKSGSWWLRSPGSGSPYSAWYVTSSGGVASYVVHSAYGVRPAFTLAI